MRTPQDCTERPHRLPLTVFRPNCLEPMSIIRQEIAKAPRLWVKSVPNQSHIALSKLIYLARHASLSFFEQHRQNQGTHVVIRAISLIKIWCGIDGVL